VIVPVSGRASALSCSRHSRRRTSCNRTSRVSRASFTRETVR